MIKQWSKMVGVIWFSVVITVILLLTTQSVNGAKSAASTEATLKCDHEGDKQIARNLARFTVYSKKNGRNWPSNRKELKSFCKESADLLQKIDLYRNQCYTGQLKQFASLFVFASRSSIKRFCGRGAKNRRFNELFELAKCVNKNKVKHNACMERLIESFVGIKYAEDNKKIPYSCCAIGEISECFGEQLVKDGCGHKRDLMEELFRSNFESLGPICNEYNNQDSDQCERLGKRPSKKPKEKVPDSILFPFYDIVNSLPQ